MTQEYQWPGTSAELALGRNLVAQTGGHFVRIIRQGVGELLGVSVRGRTVVIRDMLDVYRSSLLHSENLLVLDLNGDSKDTLEKMGAELRETDILSSSHKLVRVEVSETNFRVFAELNPPPVAKPSTAADIFHDAEGRN
jgi:hypothetical protein